MPIVASVLTWHGTMQQSNKYVSSSRDTTTIYLQTDLKAIDRCYRMGQHKEVTVKRIVVRDTIEDRILKLQLAKQDLADAELGEGEARKNGKMTINDIKMVRSPASFVSRGPN